jgi:ATP-dependent Clp protease protease subunit
MEWRLEAGDEPTIYVYDNIVDREYYNWDEEKVGVSAAGIMEQLAEFKGKRVTVRINCKGGDVFNGVAIYEALREHEGGVRTIVDGQASSAASVVMLAGDDRLISRGGMVMIHEPLCYCGGNRTELKAIVESLDAITESVINLYHERTGAKKADLEAWMSATKYFSSADAIKHGFATGYIGESTEKKDSTKMSADKARYTDPKLVLALAAVKRRRAALAS